MKVSPLLIFSSLSDEVRAKEAASNSTVTITDVKAARQAKPIKNPFRDGHVIRNDMKMSRDVAAAYCESLGGALPIPQSQEENDWLRELGDTHLGFTVGDGQDYTNWHTGTHNGAGEPSGDSSYVQLIKGWSWNVFWNGKWNDGGAPWAATCYIPEESPKCPEDQGFVLYEDTYCLNFLDQRMRWDHGKAACEAIGGHLPKVTESGLQTQLLKLVGAIRSEVGVWIGLNDFENERGTSKTGWVWHDGTKLGWSNWAGHEPNMDHKHEQDCVGIFQTFGNRWGNWYCWNTLDVVCQITESSWSSWSEWSECDCKAKTQSRNRSCSKVDGMDCAGDDVETKSCSCANPWITWTPGSPSATLETFGGVFWQSSTDNINSDPDTFC